MTHRLGGALAVVAMLLLVPTASADTSAPIVSYTLSGTEGANGWFRSDITIRWSVTDPEGLTSTSGCEIAQLVTSEGTTTHTCTATSQGGATSSTATLKIDKTPPTVSGASASRGPDSNGWYNHPVTFAFTGSDALSGIASCSSPTYGGGDGASVGVSGACTDAAGNSSAALLVTLQYDATPPSVAAASASRGPDSNGWYNHPVTFAFTGSDATSGIASCSSPTYGGGDGASVGVSGACTDAAGNSSAASLVTLQYDATPPSVAAAADRPPSGAWYRAPVTVSFRGTDATSGIGGCSPPLRYAGPDGEAAAVKGSCTDNAGNAAEASLAFKYDATPPKLAAPKVEEAKGLVRMSWQRAADFVSTQLLRTPGLGSAKRSVVYKGSGASFADRSVRNGRRYRYELIVGDAAGNLSGRVVTAMPRPPLYRPGPGQRVRAPLTLAWDAVSGARFYNVQLLRNGVKMLSAWPRLATLRVRAAWRYAGKARRLEPGRYVWYVWPARGTIERPVFGRPIGSSSFVVRGGA